MTAAAVALGHCTFTSAPDMGGRLIPLPFIGAAVRTQMDNRR